MITELGRLEGLRNLQNTELLKDVLELLKKHYYGLAEKYGQCRTEFMSSKVVKLIDILKAAPEELTKDKVSDMVLVFAFKRRTVKFLQLVLDKYRN
jgi:DNA-binding transcriptional regulator GbsR (MarR family)